MITDRASLRALDEAYRLLDAGDGRRLESFGGRIVDRPAQGAQLPPRSPQTWHHADLRYQGQAGWQGRPEALEPWAIDVDALRIELRPTASGQLGVYPEHLASLPWLAEQVRAAERRGPVVLNLFAYTGLVTLALAGAGASVVHVDAARSAVAWARRNAELSSLSARPIRWIVDDAEAFVTREARRGRHYDGFVIDPPSWGHAATGAKAWRIDTRLADLLAACAAIAAPAGAFCLLSAHTTGLGPDAIREAAGAAFRRPIQAVEAGILELGAESGAHLPLGVFARLTR